MAAEQVCLYHGAYPLSSSLLNGLYLCTEIARNISPLLQPTFSIGASLAPWTPIISSGHYNTATSASTDETIGYTPKVGRTKLYCTYVVVYWLARSEERRVGKE